MYKRKEPIFSNILGDYSNGQVGSSLLRFRHLSGRIGMFTVYFIDSRTSVRRVLRFIDGGVFVRNSNVISPSSHTQKKSKKVQTLLPTTHHREDPSIIPDHHKRVRMFWLKVSGESYNRNCDDSISRHKNFPNNVDIIFSIGLVCPLSFLAR